MLRRELFARLHGFDVSLHGTDDVDFTLRAARLARFAYCREVLAAHHISGHNMSSPSAVWYQEIIRYTRLILASPADADLHAPARQFLRQMYRQLIFFHGRHRQPRLAWATLRASRDSGLDGLSLLCALGAWLGPLPFMAMGRLLWSQA
jgi:GT2 family glycosyltransferase